MTRAALPLLLALCACTHRLGNDAPPLTTAARGTASVSVASGADDVQELAFGKIIAADPTLELSQTGELVALRFTGLGIPPGAGITKAHLSLTAARASEEPGTFAVRAALTDGPVPLADGAVRGLAAGFASATWEAESWVQGGRYESSDLSPVVAEVVANEAWAAGGSLTLILSGGGGAMKTAAAYELTGAQAATLHVEYDTSVPNGGGFGGFLGPVTLPPDSCLKLGTGPLTTITGLHKRRITVRNLQNARIDGHGMRVTETNYPLAIGHNRGSLCLSGGVITTPWPFSTDWDTTHGTGAMIVYETPNLVVESIAAGVDNQVVGDGIMIKDRNPGWVYRDSYIARAADDGIENDRYNPGIADNLLFDSVFQGLSCRHEPRAWDPGRPYLFTVQNSLIALDPVRSHRLIKWPIVGTNYCHIALKNNVIWLPRDAGQINPNTHPNIARQGGDLLVESACVGARNTIVYTGGSQKYLEQLKRESPVCFEVTTDKGVWDRARADWFARHPQFKQWE